MPRIVHFTETGGPEVLKIVEVGMPVPAPGEVRLRIKAFGLNRSESMWRAGEYPEKAKLPARIGYEAAGVVDAVGPGVTEFAIGDAVNTVPAFSMNHYGMYGEVLLAPVSAVVNQPTSLSFEEAASIWMMFITVYGAFIENAKLAAGDTVIIPAASSSVGLAAIQVAHFVGATPIALTRTGAKRQRLLNAGATHVIVTDEQDLVAEVLRITGGAGARLVFDPVGGPTFPKLIRATKKGGQVLLYGALSTEITPLPMLEMQLRTPTIQGYVLWSTTMDPPRLKAATNFTLRGLQSGAFKPVIDKVFPFEQIVEAHRYLEANQQFGKIVVTV
jgi:NADPH:quinone reductase-like Zn-dependent oxidoreductase